MVGILSDEDSDPLEGVAGSNPVFECPIEELDETALTSVIGKSLTIAKQDGIAAALSYTIKDFRQDVEKFLVVLTLESV